MPAVTASLIAAGGQAASSIINNTVSNLFQSGKIAAQKDQILLQSRLMQLNASQQEALAVQLQNAQTQDEQLQILDNAAAQIQSAGVAGNATILAAAVQNQAMNSIAIAGIVIAAVAVLGIGLHYINKNN